MAAYYFNGNIFLSGNCYSGFLDPFSCDLGPCNGISQSLVLDNEKRELVVKSPVKVGKKSMAEEKVIAALKSHSEAERRRERINAHLDTLRTLLPYREKGNWIWEHAKLKARMQTLQRNLRNVMKIIIFSPTRTKKENG
ncbi:hypothetical protein E1A91_A07G209900v1 [Gossypium mustelinum]|uniref:BHLH domain-containing protein n=4 Tax=Gossypium TaxID=3633 RepID=A0A5J5V633_GOSBA|nr:hypothetical protein ES319_A07G201000v1 [Gossypium barbadense]TYH10938.1 hypothetical protein ES288_A07G218200v1 [Gossypium darwinii]TYI20147.1 hypothetical protein ES332_A07G216000v1 [Gossypium tomentosum]TYJ27746.1 hypothetical protein E1A91_A07G209900v1 [Gossypium mustelinum]